MSNCELCGGEHEGLKKTFVFVPKLDIPANTAQLCVQCDALTWISVEDAEKLRQVVARRESREPDELWSELENRQKGKTLYDD